MKEFLGFLVFLAVTLCIASGVASLGTYPCYFLFRQGFTAEAIRNTCVVLVILFGLLGYIGMQRGKNVFTFICFLAMTVFAAVWFRDIGRVTIFKFPGHTEVSHVPQSDIELLFAFTFIVGGLIGMLINSGIQFSRKTV